MVRSKMTQGRVTEVSCLLDLAISLDRLSLAMGEQLLKKMGFSWASWTNRMTKSIVVRFVVRKGMNMEEHGRKADGQRSPGILVDCPPVSNERR